MVWDIRFHKIYASTRNEKSLLKKKYSTIVRIFPLPRYSIDISTSTEVSNSTFLFPVNNSHRSFQKYVSGPLPYRRFLGCKNKQKKMLQY